MLVFCRASWFWPKFDLTVAARQGLFEQKPFVIGPGARIEERKTTMNQDKFDDDYLRSIQEGLEKMLEELLKEEE